MIHQRDDLIGFPIQWSRVAGDELFALPYTDNQRASAASRQQKIWLAVKHHDYTVSSSELSKHFSKGRRMSYR
jgi:hypothetical protein